MPIEPTLSLDSLTQSGKILASCLALSKSLAVPGTTPKEIDSEVHSFILKNDAHPSFLGYDGFPNTTCIAVNEQVVHAIPSNTPLKEGDLVTVDIGVSFEHHCTDAARSFIVGRANSLAEKLVATAYTALNAGIKQATSANRVGDISFAIQREVELQGFRSPMEFGGHGIGTKPHTAPFIPNAGMKGKGIPLVYGMCLAIEPIVMIGSTDVFVDETDGFTIIASSGKLSAHVEDTIVVTDREPIILTRETLLGGVI